MSVIDDHRRHEMPRSGFFVIGTTLFAGEALADMLRRKTSTRVAKASTYALVMEPFSQLQVRRRLVDAAKFHAPIVLEDEVRWTVRRRPFDLQFHATLAFTGDPCLFHAQTEGRPGRCLKATIRDSQLTIAVRTSECDRLMVPYAVASEIAAIRQELAVQQSVIDAFNRRETESWTAFVSEQWAVLCQERPFVQSQVRAIAEKEKAELLKMHEVLFGQGKQPTVRQIVAFASAGAKNIV
jgi:hypothetical protein